MSIEENKKRALRVIDAYNTGDMSLLEGMVSDDYVQHSPGVPPDRGSMMRFFQSFLASFPDGHFHVEDIMAEGDRVLIRWSCSGTQSGPWMGMPPTGRKVSFMGMDLWRFEDGKLAEAWFLSDTLGMLQQLGRIPAGGAAGQRAGR